MKNILITGSSSGIGKVAAETLKAEGYKVFQTGRKLLDIENYISINLSDPNNVNKLYNYVKENFGDIDILVNNAGEYVYSPIDKMKPDEIIQIFNSNFISHYYLTSLVVPYMKQKKFGRIVNIASISGVVGEANASLYSATKSAYFGFSKALALELAEYNITVNSISPGWVETQLTENALSEEEKKETLDVIPQKRFVEPVEVANLIKYLISDNAKGITGQNINPGQNINLCAGLSCGC